MRLYEEARFEDRAQHQELRIDESKKPLLTPKFDFNNKLKTHNVERYFCDDRFPADHERHIVLRTHHALLIDGTIAASGKFDPKEMIIGDVQYRQLEHVNPRCALCEGGDMIAQKDRFMSSDYRPPVSE